VFVIGGGQASGGGEEAAEGGGESLVPPALEGVRGFSGGEGLGDVGCWW